MPAFSSLPQLSAAVARLVLDGLPVVWSQPGTVACVHRTVHLVAVWLVFKIARRLAAIRRLPCWRQACSHSLRSTLRPWCGWQVGIVLATALTWQHSTLSCRRADGTARNWAGAIALYAGALCRHESATAFPALVACYAFIFVEGTRRHALWMRARRAVIWSAPFAIELLLYMGMRRLVLGFFVSNPYDFANLLTNAQAVLTVPLVLQPT